MEWSESLFSFRREWLQTRDHFEITVSSYAEVPYPGVICLHVARATRKQRFTALSRKPLITQQLKGLAFPRLVSG